MLFRGKGGVVRTLSVAGLRERRSWTRRRGCKLARKSCCKRGRRQAGTGSSCLPTSFAESLILRRRWECMPLSTYVWLGHQRASREYGDGGGSGIKRLDSKLNASGFRDDPEPFEFCLQKIVYRKGASSVPRVKRYIDVDPPPGCPVKMVYIPSSRRAA
ncbi:uncharacterized protein LY79DRAFT_262257 [Colletotrichum navitas]|uniref:Uncharacterized protein n=1 Tax=Colletotrichum navitas TaxID=681940 RepID=A0AAD8PW99_9PEZI|nr:uncharacterized protein LY79DRAFT_262257 [Colletotrichum navitas]KAK1585642.1 hypothetical protein LY79DRAFT_262257 [Colletotrichum navitas]